MNLEIIRIGDFYTSHCCHSGYETIFIEGGKVELRCTKCRKVCAVLEEKFTKGNYHECYN